MRDTEKTSKNFKHALLMMDVGKQKRFRLGRVVKNKLNESRLCGRPKAL
jgi:hypothetical protein